MTNQEGTDKCYEILRLSKFAKVAHISQPLFDTIHVGASCGMCFIDLDYDGTLPAETIAKAVDSHWDYVDNRRANAKGRER